MINGHAHTKDTWSLKPALRTPPHDSYRGVCDAALSRGFIHAASRLSSKRSDLCGEQTVCRQDILRRFTSYLLAGRISSIFACEMTPSLPHSSPLENCWSGAAGGGHAARFILGNLRSRGVSRMHSRTVSKPHQSVCCGEIGRCR